MPADLTWLQSTGSCLEKGDAAKIMLQETHSRGSWSTIGSSGMSVCVWRGEGIRALMLSTAVWLHVPHNNVWCSTAMCDSSS